MDSQCLSVTGTIHFLVPVIREKQIFKFSCSLFSLVFSVCFRS